MADALQKFNLKKGAIQKALDTLADTGRISFKEYGKQKIYLARQDQFDIPDSEELTRMKEENAKFQEKISEQKRELSNIEGGTFFMPLDGSLFARFLFGIHLFVIMLIFFSPKLIVKLVTF